MVFKLLLGAAFVAGCWLVLSACYHSEFDMALVWALPTMAAAFLLDRRMKINQG